MRFNLILCIYEHILKYTFGELGNIFQSRFLCIYLFVNILLFLVQIKGRYNVIRIEETKLVCVISWKLIEKHNLLAKGGP